MSQLDLLTELRSARPVAPPELREHVRQLAAAAAAPPRRRFTSRRSLFVLVPVAAALVAVAGVAILQPGNSATVVNGVAPDSPMRALPAFKAQAQLHTSAGGAPEHGALLPADVDNGVASSSYGPMTKSQRALLPALPTVGNLGSTARIQRISTTLELRLRNAAAVSGAAQRANAITRSLHGYVQSADVNASGRNGDAELVLRIPRSHVNEAVSRLSALGRVTSENFGVQDLTAQVNTAKRHIATLQRKLTALRAETTVTPQITRQIAALTAQIQRLQRGTAATVRQAHDATIDLRMSTPPRKEPVAPAKPSSPGPFHGLGVAFHWIWIGAVYFLALGVPLLLLVGAVWLAVRALRHRREEQLLSEA